MPAVIKKEKNNKIFIPDTKIKANHDNVISKDWPKSGWEIKSNNIGIRIPALKIYFKYNFLLFKESKIEIIIIKNGFKISIGWNLGKKKGSNHLLDPFTSIPRKGTKNKQKKDIKKNIIENLIKVFCFKIEKNNKKIIPSKINDKCFKKK